MKGKQCHGNVNIKPRKTFKTKARHEKNDITSSLLSHALIILVELFEKNVKFVERFFIHNLTCGKIMKSYGKGLVLPGLCRLNG